MVESLVSFDRFCADSDLEGNEPENIDLLVYAAGYYLEGAVGGLELRQMVTMNAIGFLFPVLLLNAIVQKQQALPGFIAITSTSQWTPRKDEWVYTGVKAGLAMLAESVSLDDSIGKVLVAAPAGMKTPFWRNEQKDLSSMLDPVWVAEEILKLFEGEEYKYRFAKILRNPARIENVATRLK